MTLEPNLFGLCRALQIIMQIIFAFCKKDVCTEIYPDLKRDRHHRVTLVPEKKRLNLFGE